MSLDEILSLRQQLRDAQADAFRRLQAKDAENAKLRAALERAYYLMDHGEPDEAWAVISHALTNEQVP